MLQDLGCEYFGVAMRGIRRGSGISMPILISAACPNQLGGLIRPHPCCFDLNTARLINDLAKKG